MLNNINMQSYLVEMFIVFISGSIIGIGIDELQKRVLKLIFKKGSRKNVDKSYFNFVLSLLDVVGQKFLFGKLGGLFGIVSNNSVEIISFF